MSASPCSSACPVQTVVGPRSRVKWTPQILRALLPAYCRFTCLRRQLPEHQRQRCSAALARAGGQGLFAPCCCLACRQRWNAGVERQRRRNWPICWAACTTLGAPSQSTLSVRRMSLAHATDCPPPRLYLGTPAVNPGPFLRCRAFVAVDLNLAWCAGATLTGVRWIAGLVGVCHLCAALAPLATPAARITSW